MRNWFHGGTKKHSYFEGWYFRQHTGGQALAFIPALNIDGEGHRSASIQVITNTLSERALYPIESFQTGGDGLCVTVGGSRFSEEGVIVNIKTDHVEIRGELAYGAFSRPRYDIMGPFRYVPNMQCRHSVISMAHTVWGELCINGETLLFENALGYLEGDRGHSFPKRYFWTQGMLPDGTSIMLSIADIPFMGVTFTGIIGFVYKDGSECRIATYLGAKLDRMGKGFVSVRQGDYLLQAELIAGTPKPLYAANSGRMERVIHESASARVRYRLFLKGRAVLDTVGECAGYENEYYCPESNA